MSSINRLQAPAFPLYQLPLATSRPSGLGQHEPVDQFVVSRTSEHEGAPLNWSRAIALKASLASDPFRAGGCDEISCHRRKGEKVGDPNAVEDTLEALHMTLSAGSMIPFVGTAAGLLDALLQAARGKWQDVALDLAGAIPFAGTVAKGAALVKGGLAVKGAVAAKSLMVVKSSAAGIAMHVPLSIRNEALSIARREAAEVAKQTEKASAQAVEKFAERSLASELEEGAAYYRQLSKGGHAPTPAPVRPGTTPPKPAVGAPTPGGTAGKGTEQRGFRGQPERLRMNELEEKKQKMIRAIKWLHSLDFSQLAKEGLTHQGRTAAISKLNAELVEVNGELGKLRKGFVSISL